MHIYDRWKIEEDGTFLVKCWIGEHISEKKRVLRKDIIGQVWVADIVILIFKGGPSYLT